MRDAVIIGAGAASALASAAPAAEKVQVKLETSKGVIVLELDPAKAPKTVDNFLEYVRTGHYDGTIFHRVIPGFMIQGGGFTADLARRSRRASRSSTRPPTG